MAVQRTFSIIKPDATKRNITGKVNAKIEEAGLRTLLRSAFSLLKSKLAVFMLSIKSVHSMVTSSNS